MTPKKNIILVNILSEIINIVYVMAESRPPDVSVAATWTLSADMALIAEDICRDLSFYSEDADISEAWLTKCQQNFLSEAVLPSSPPQIQFCRLEEQVSFKLSPTETPWRLVVQVPDDDTVTDIIIYSLMENDKPYSTITTLPGASYTVWTASLNSHGRHSPWLRGPQISPWEVTNQQYNVNVELQYEDKSESTVRALFHWDQDDANSTCYNVMSSCDNVEMIEETLWTNKENKSQSWVFSNLPTNVSCEFRVSGARGTTVQQYRTECREPMTCMKQSKATDLLESEGKEDKIAIESAEDQEKTQNETIITPIDPKKYLNDREPQNVTLLAIDSAGNGWDVRVDWVLPKIVPDKYNITVVVGKQVRRTVLVPGNQTEAILRNIEGEGYYYVIIDTILVGKNNTRTSRHSIFPEKSNLTGLVTSVVVLSEMILVVGGYMCLRRRQANKQKRSYFLDLDEKPSKDALEPFDVECSKKEEQWEVGSRRLLLHEVVGEGAFGVVRRGTLAGEEVAVKMLKDFPTQDEIRSFHAEIDLMRLMKTVGRHAHVLSLVECCGGRRPLILTEYCSGGDLLSYLRCIWDVMVSKRKAKYYNNNIESSEYRNDLFKCKFEGQHSKLVVNKLYDLQGICDTELTSRDLLSFCRQIAMGMDFLASNKVVHRDLAARNILVAKDRTLKIADFGLSRDVYEENQYKQKGNGKMPVKWMALESLERKIYTTKSDIWSFGVVVWEIVTVGGSPYPDVPAARLLRSLRDGYRMQRPHNCSADLYDLMLSCWHAQPSARPSFSSLHRRLDELLNSVCAEDYLSLEMSDDVRPPARSRYVRMIKEKLGWSRESYSAPCRAPPAHNHYTSPPAAPLPA